MPKLHALTSLRFFAAILVVFQHYFGFEFGHAGVSFFFILSGFVLAYNYADLDLSRVGDFYVKRVARIYPTYVVTMIAAVPIFISADMSLFSSENLLRLVTSLSLVQSFVADKSFYFSYNAVAWSISCEAFFYLLFPLILARLRSDPRAYRNGSFVVAGLVALAAAAWSAVLWPIGTIDHTATHWLFYISPMMRIAEFVLGVGIGLRFVRTNWSHSPNWRYAAVLAWMMTLVSANYMPRGAFALLAASWFVPASYLTIIAFAINTPFKDMLGRLLVNRFLVLLGESSFMLYMIHTLVLSYSSAIVELSLPTKCVLIFVAIALSVLGHLLFEKPAYKAILAGYRS